MNNATAATGIPIEILFAVIGALILGLAWIVVYAYRDLRSEVLANRRAALKTRLRVNTFATYLALLCERASPPIPFHAPPDDDDV